MERRVWVYMISKVRFYKLGADECEGGMNTVKRAMEIVRVVREARRAATPCPLRDLLLPEDDITLVETLAAIKVATLGCSMLSHLELRTYESNIV